MSFLLALPLTVLPQQDDTARKVHELIKKLGSNRIQVRDEAARNLKELGEAAIPELGKAANAADAELAGRARFLIHTIGIRKTLTSNLLKAMPGLDYRLAQGGAGAWTTAFLEAVEEDDEGRKHPTLKKQDLETLGRPALRGATTKGEREEICKVAIARGLGSLVPEVVILLKDDASHVRRMAVVALRDLGAIEAIPAILPLLKDRDPYVRWGAANAIGVMGVRDTSSAIVPLLIDDDRLVRMTAVTALANVGARDTIPQIIGSLQDKDLLVRSRAAWALGQLNAKEAISEIEKLLDHRSPDFRESGAWALGILQATEAIPRIRELLKDNEGAVRDGAVWALGLLDAREAIPDILALLTDEDAYVRPSAVQALGQLHAKEAIPAIVTCLGDEDKSVQKNSLAALEALGAEKCKRQIAEMLLSSDNYVRHLAASILARMGTRQGVTTLLGESGSPLSLNALRRPDAWRRLSSTSVEGSQRGSKREIIERLAERADTRVTWPSDSSMEELLSLAERRVIQNWRNSLTLLNGMKLVLGWRHEIVLEPDRIRILPREEALTFWRAWWAKQQEKRK